MHEVLTLYESELTAAQRSLAIVKTQDIEKLKIYIAELELNCQRAVEDVQSVMKVATEQNDKKEVRSVLLCICLLDTTLLYLRAYAVL